MGFLYKSGRVRSFILIFLTLLALVVCIPVGNHFISLIKNGISKVLEDIQKETGLKISYQSMSPSLMKNVSIRQIEISSEEGKILFIENVKEYYGMENVHVVDEAEVEQEPSNVNHTKNIIIFTFVTWES